MGDLKWFLLILIGLFFVWIVTGGPDRESSYDPFIHQPNPIGEGGTYKKRIFPTFSVLDFSLNKNTESSVDSNTEGLSTNFNNIYTNTSETNTDGTETNTFYTNPTNTNQSGTETTLPTTNPTVSSYEGLVTLNKARASREDVDDEYLIINVSKNATGSINIGGWKIRSTISGNSVTIPYATYLLRLGGENNEFPISAQPGDKIYVSTGSSPIGVSFRINLCTGYLEQFQDFSPSLPRKCPRAEDEIPPEYAFGSGPNAFNSDCIDFIEKISLCKINTKDIPYQMQTQCQEFVTKEINYNACATKHKNESDFYGNEWRLYLKRDVELWREQREVIELVDSNNLVVDVITY